MGIKSGEVGAVITSPPYATALPYIDTDRLSLVALGLADDRALRSLEADLIGSRDITVRERLKIEAAITAGLQVPASVVDFLQELLQRVGDVGDSAGFRRRNMPSLLARYFEDIAACVVVLRVYCAPGAIVAMVVGGSRLKLGGWRIQIPARDLNCGL